MSPKPAESEGLQTIQPHDAPEVYIPEPEFRAKIARTSSLNSPEAFPGSPPPPDQKRRYDYLGGPQQETRAYYTPGGSFVEKQENTPASEKKIFGWRRKVFFWILGIVIVIVIIAAVLGGVLETVLGKSSSKSTSSKSGSNGSPKPKISPPALQHNTGIAVIEPEGSSDLYEYYHDPKGRIVENQFIKGNWSISGTDVPNSAIIARDAVAGSPLTATSWTSSGALFRAVFYLDGSGRLMTTNTTGSNPWPTPVSILTDDSAPPHSNALAVVADTNTAALNGLRVYWASSSEGIIREVGINFGDSGWSMWGEYAGSDPQSGVAAVLSGNINHLYLVDTGTRALQQWTWDYSVNDNTSWQKGVKGKFSIPIGSDIAAVNDGVNTDHIFWQDSQNHVFRALYYGQGISDLQEVATCADGSKLSATYDTSSSSAGATVYYRQDSPENEVAYTTITRNNQRIGSGVIR